MSTPHKCPVCNGTGKVSTPPYVAGDLETFTSSSAGPWPCNACNGSGIVWEYSTVNIPSIFRDVDGPILEGETTTNVSEGAPIDYNLGLEAYRKYSALMGKELNE